MATPESASQAATVKAPAEVAPSSEPILPSEPEAPIEQYATAALWTTFAKEIQENATHPLQQLLELEYEAMKTREELAALHQSRVDHHLALQQKREQIVAGISQYMAPFQETMTLSPFRG